MAVLITPQRRVLAMANSQIGYSRWSDPKSGTKYARETQSVFWPKSTWLLANGISYCDIFITWVIWKALGKEFVDKHLPAGASYNTDYRASHGGHVDKTKAQPGDILVFDWNWSTRATNHVGFLEKNLSGNRFQTIEGNTSIGTAGSQSNGGRVARRVRRHDQVRYVIRPNWAGAGASASTGAISVPKPVVTHRSEVWETSPRIKGMSKSEIIAIQKLLIGAGYSVGSYGADGSYKGDTVTAVKKAQAALKLTVDGVAGPDTVAGLKKLQKAPAKAPTFPLPRKPGAMYFYGIGKEKTAVTGKTKNTGVPGDVVKGGPLGWYSKGLKLWQAAAGITADGRFGTGTEVKVKALQKKHGQKVDGKIGPDTWKLAWA